MSKASKSDRVDPEIALKNAADLLAHDPRLAEEQVLESYHD